jgi:hypothetical protein
MIHIDYLAELPARENMKRGDKVTQDNFAGSERTVRRDRKKNTCRKVRREYNILLK